MKFWQTLLLALIIVGCSHLSKDSDSGLAQDDPLWFKGSVESALAEAKKSERPILTFWGAGWCIECYRVKKTILAKAEFTEVAAKYIPLYMDMDQSETMRWAEKWQVHGIPVLLVVGKDGQEKARLQGENLSVAKVLAMLRR